MREQCSCGSGIVTWRYDRVKEWRGSHRCSPVTMLNILEAEAEEALQAALWDEEAGEDEWH